MPALLRSRARSRASAVVLILASSLAVAALSTPAQAAPVTTKTTTSTTSTTAAKPAAHKKAAAKPSWRSQVPAAAAKHRGNPYQYGADGPTRFDCSGLTMYVYKQFGKSLPHNAAQQYSVMHHVAKNQKVPGDLLFFYSGGRISHVAIYAGPSHMSATRNKPMMWHAPHTGDVVKEVPIYSGSYVVGRL